MDTHFKALSALGVNSDSYAMAIMPDLMKKLPRGIVISVKRAKEIHHEWSMAEFLDAFWQELVLRGMNEQKPSERETSKEVNRGKSFSISSKMCAYCLGNHESKAYEKATDIAERKKIIMIYKRCLQYLRKGHQIRDRRDKRECSNCHKIGHHVSICKQEESTPNLHVKVKEAPSHIKQSKPLYAYQENQRLNVECCSMLVVTKNTLTNQ